MGNARRVEKGGLAVWETQRSSETKYDCMGNTRRRVEREELRKEVLL